METRMKWIDFVVGYRLAPRVFLRVHPLSFIHKTNISKFQFYLETFDLEPLRGMCPCKLELFSFITLLLTKRSQL